VRWGWKEWALECKIMKDLRSWMSSQTVSGEVFHMFSTCSSVLKIMLSRPSVIWRIVFLIKDIVAWVECVDIESDRSNRKRTETDRRRYWLSALRSRFLFYANTTLIFDGRKSRLVPDFARDGSKDGRRRSWVSTVQVQFEVVNSMTRLKTSRIINLKWGKPGAQAWRSSVWTWIVRVRFEVVKFMTLKS
jgi:hypothetical protein